MQWTTDGLSLLPICVKFFFLRYGEFELQLRKIALIASLYKCFKGGLPSPGSALPGLREINYLHIMHFLHVI